MSNKLIIINYLSNFAFHFIEKKLDYSSRSCYIQLILCTGKISKSLAASSSSEL